MMCLLTNIILFLFILIINFIDVYNFVFSLVKFCINVKNNPVFSRSHKMTAKSKKVAGPVLGNKTLMTISEIN